MKEDLFNDIIARFLAGNATAYEKEMLSNWLKQDREREEVFYLQVLKHESECPQHFPEIDSIATAYEQFLRGGKRITPKVAQDEQPPRSGTGLYKWWWAASLALFIALGLYAFSDSLFYKTYTAQKGTTRSVTLEDGSLVTLNANSSIKVLRDFMDHENREVWINGEAFFEVTRKSDQMKFIVHTRNFDVEVLGTKFNVNNRCRKTEVMLAEGKVKLVSSDKRPLIMEPGEKVTLADGYSHYRKELVNPKAYDAWRNNMLVFENTPLAEVARTIHNYYGIKVSISDSLLATRKFTGTLPNKDLDVILLALSTAYNLQFDRRDDEIIVREHEIN